MGHGVVLVEVSGSPAGAGSTVYIPLHSPPCPGQGSKDAVDHSVLTALRGGRAFL